MDCIEVINKKIEEIEADLVEFPLLDDFDYSRRRHREQKAKLKVLRELITEIGG